MTRQPAEQSRGQRIRDEFARAGAGMSTASFAQHCITWGVWTVEELDQFTLKAAQAEVRKELKVLDAKGLPFAGKTTETDETGAPVWSQRTYWTVDDYGVNIAEYDTQIGTLSRQREAMKSECVERYGVLPFARTAAD